MPKNILICMDGTWNNDEDKDINTNVNTFCEMTDSNGQMKIYYPGVGYSGRPFSRLLDGILGKGAFPIVRRAYKTIQDNYSLGDKIFIIGFSRGAFAARHLAGMIVKLGLSGHVEQNFLKYLDTINDNYIISTQKVHFLGLFDCVPGNQVYLSYNSRLRGLNNNKLEDNITYFCHAVAKHERRFSFRPLIFQPTKGHDQTRWKQHWFNGTHGDVGGLGVRGLSAFTLWWMVREAYGAGLDFNDIKCNPFYHRNGKNLKIVQRINPEADPGSSDWWLTKTGLKWEREKKAESTWIDPIPQINNLIDCPRKCGEYMF